jgi:hypothetical protein
MGDMSDVDPLFRVVDAIEDSIVASSQRPDASELSDERFAAPRALSESVKCGEDRIPLTRRQAAQILGGSP